MKKFTIANAADIETIENTPLEKHLPAYNSYELIKNTAELYPDNPAIRFLPTGKMSDVAYVLSYAEFLTQLHKTANLFLHLGIGENDVISYLLPNLPQTHLTIWGGEASGIVNPVNPMLEPAVITEIMNESGSKILVALGPVPETDIWQKVKEITTHVSSLKYILRVDPNASFGKYSWPDPEEGYSIAGVPIIDFDRAIVEKEGNYLLNNRTIEPQDIAAFFHTGGTTGLPKIAQHSHLNEVANAVVFGAATAITGPINVFVGLPLFHVNAVIVTGLSIFANGGCVTLLSPQGYRNPNVIRNFWKLVDKYDATQFSCVPTVLTSLLNTKIENSDISSLNLVICGAAPLSVALCEEFEKTFDVKILEGYGLTEGTCVSSFNPLSGQRRIGSIGLRLPYQSMKTVVIDEKGKFNRNCEIDEVGAIVIKGPNVFPGYKQKDANKNIFVAEGWLSTGDLGRQDANGYFWLTGRSKDLIIRGGHNIDPGIIEACLAGHPSIAEVAAIGQPDEYAGELPCAYVVLKISHNITYKELLEYARNNIQERAATPVYLEILTEMPLTAVGKIFKPALKIKATERVLNIILQKENIFASVTVRSDDKYGLVAAVKPYLAMKDVKQALQKFTIRIEDNNE